MSWKLWLKEKFLIASIELQKNGISVIIKGMGPGITFEFRERVLF